MKKQSDNTFRFNLSVVIALCLGLVLGGVILVGTYSCLAASPPTEIVVTPGQTSDVLLNPGKGWVLYGMPADHRSGEIGLATTGYMRFDWSEIEPQEGVYNWNVIDSYISAWRSAGKKFAFGIMNVNTFSPQSYVTPKWVFDTGAAYWTYNLTDSNAGLPGTKIIPVWSDNIFKIKLNSFITTLGLHYNGNFDVAFVDFRAYGNWGEGHNYPYGGSELTPVELQTELQWQLQAFSKTQVIVPWGETSYNTIYDWAVNAGMGMRSDGILGNPNGSEVARAYGHAPGVFEFYASYQQALKNGRWSAQTLQNDLQIGKPSYVSMGMWGNDSEIFLKDQAPLIRQLANTMGYYFVLQSAQFPATMGVGVTDTIKLSWLNKGVAPFYLNAKVALGLLDENNQVRAKVWLGSNPKTWLPGAALSESFSFNFGAQPAGRYRLVVGLFEDPAQLNPSIQLGITGRIAGNWYLLENPPAKDKDIRSADLVAQLRVSPDRVFAEADPANLLTYSLNIKNVGTGNSKGATIRFPFDPALLVGYASFSDKQAWVTAIVTDSEQPYMQIRLPGIEAGQSISGTLVFRPGRLQTSEKSVFTRYTLRWDDNGGVDKGTFSNGVQYIISNIRASRNESEGQIQLFNPATLTASGGEKIKIVGSFYLANEWVTLWYSDRDNKSRSLGSVLTASDGSLTFEFDTSVLANGETYILAGYGNRSEITGSTLISVVDQAKLSRSP